LHRAARSIAFDGGLVVLAGDDRLFLLDDLAAQIWRSIECGLSATEITKALTEANPTQSAQIVRDVSVLLSQWRAEGLLDQSVPVAGRTRVPAALDTEPVWAGKWKCAFHNLVVEVAVENPEEARLLGRLLEHFPAGSVEPSARIEARENQGGEALIFVDGHEYARTCTVRNVQRALLRLIWPNYPLCALIHGGAVALGDRAACFAGISGSGKTTLIACLVSQGLTYLADDLTAVDTVGRILPWPMPMSVKLGDAVEQLSDIGNSPDV
jgi:coenzyme PQQ synthesis protein D (PqqD)